MNLAQTSSQTAHVETLVSTCVTAEAYKFGQLGLPVGSALAMEYQSRKFVLRKADPTAALFWQTASLLHLSTA